MLESYITPLLMGYVNKYIKNLKPSDLSLSVWGGDVVLQNLELNLDVLQKELSLPVKFLSGRIHELQIHVPWTRITYEPVTITINTIEFVVKLRDPDEVKSDSGADETDNATARELKKEMQKAKTAREAEHLPPGYVQGVINKVVNNISVCVNNLILKYVEDDIVFSLNVKSVNLFSANENWEQAFVGLTLPSLCLRKICNINNLTICLDRRNADGKIEMYQDPILYKCNLSCRILSKYMGLGSVSAYENHVNVYCESLDLSSTDVQLPMVIRLLKLCMGLYYRTLDLPGCNYKLHPAEQIVEERRHVKQASENYSASRDEQDGKINESSWVSWAWSMVPNLQDEGNQGKNQFHFDEDAVLLFGVYVTQCSLTLKVTNEAHDSSIVGSKRFEFSPVFNIEMSGCAVEIISKGEEYFDCQFGVCNIVGYMIGECLCKKREGNAYNVRSNASMDFDELDKETEDELLFQLGSPNDTAENGVGFLEDSLFRQPKSNIDDIENSSLYKKTVLPEKGKQFNEGKIAKKFGAFSLDYFYTMELPNDDGNDTDNSEAWSDLGKGKDLIKEFSSKRMIIGNLNFFVTSRFHHMVTKVIEFCTDDVQPRKVKDGIFIDDFVTKQLKLGNFSTRGLHLTCHAMKFTVSYTDHIFGKSDNVHDDKVLGTQNMHGILLQIDRFDYQATSPTFPNELNALLESESKPKPMFYRAAYSDYFAKFFGLQIGLCEYRHELSEPVLLNIVPPTHAAFYANVFIGKKPTEKSAKLELRVKMPNLTASMTKTQLMMLAYIAKSWFGKNPSAFDQFLVDDVFHPKANQSNSSSILEASLIGVDLKFLQTDVVHAIQGSFGSIKVSQQSLYKGTLVDKAVMYGPLNTSELGNIISFLDETKRDVEEVPNGALLSFKIQVPIDPLQKHEAIGGNACTVVKFDMKGIAVVLNDELLKWIEYKPSTVPRRRYLTLEKRPSRILSRSFSASTPKKKSYARMLGNSPSKASREQRTSKQDKDVTTSVKKTRESQLSIAMVLIKSAILKIDLEAFVIFLPTDSMSYGPNVTCPEFKIPFAFKTAFKNPSLTLPDTLVVNLPNVNVSSSNLKTVDLSMDIPMQRIGDGPQDSSLPWILNGNGFSMYVLSSNAIHSIPNVEKTCIWYPAPWTMFLAAADADPKTPGDPKSPLPLLHGSMTRLGVNTFAEALPFESSSNDVGYQPSLGFCIHVDLTSVQIGISKEQAEVIIQLASRFVKCIDILTTKRRSEVVCQQLKDNNGHNEVKSDRSIGDVDRRSVSTASTIDHQDVLSASTDPSVFNSEYSTCTSDNLRVSLWLQWIIPSFSLTFYGDSSLDRTRPWYKIPCEIEDISFAFDYQQGELRMKSKIGSISVKNYFIRPDCSEWECDKFGGVLLSCDDVLANSIKAVPTIQKSSPRSFLILNYTRQHLSNKNMRKRYDSVRSEATIPSENIEERNRTNERSGKYSVIEDNVYQHKLEANMQSLDILFIIEPILSVADSFLSLRSPLDSYAARIVRAPASNDADSQREGIFQPLPILDLESKGFRIIAPILDENEDGNEENVVLFCVYSMEIKSDPANRISSTVLHKDWYRQLRKHQREKNRRTKLWHVQYQVDLNGLSLWSGNWNSMNAKRQLGNDNVIINAEGQNPALEWNYTITTDNQPVKLTPLLQDFNCRSTFSPALKIWKKDTKMPLTLCATSIEVNFPKDIAAFCNPFQLNLLMSIANQTTTSLQNIGVGGTKKDAFKTSQISKSPDVIDSGISSVLSQKGTNELKNTPEPEVPYPEGVPLMNAHFPFEVFVSGSKISLSLYVPEISKDSVLYEENPVFRLIGYADIIQPTVDVRNNVIEVTLYDMVIALAESNRVSNSLPDRAMFEDVIVRTTKGKQNEKTGLFASALTVTVSIEDSAKATVRVDRPLHVDIALEMLATIELFTSKLSVIADLLSSKPKKTVLKSSQAEKALILKEIDLKTSRIHATLSTKFNSHEYKLTSALRSADILLNMRNEKHLKGFDAFIYTCYIEGFEISLCKNDKSCRLLSPCIFEFNGETESIRPLENPENCCISRMKIFVNSGLVQLKIGPLHLDYLAAILSSVQETMPKGDVEKERIAQDGNTDLKNYAEYSKDDLRTGLFDYIVRHGDETGHPLANQIVFNEEESERPPSMTWRYPVPRFLNEVTVMPLPFHVDEVMPGDDLAEIPCIIRYWDHIEQTYVTYRHFFLSQSKSETLSFPNPLLGSDGNCQVAADEWQVVVDVAIESDNDEKCETDSIPEDILKEVTSVYKTPVSATSLAACIKINSCYVPAKIPRIMYAFNIGCLQMFLENHFNTSENVQPRSLAPFFLDSYTYPSNQEACCLEVNSLICKGLLSGNDNALHNVSVEFDASLDVMNYKDLSWRNCLSVSSVIAEMSLNTEPQTEAKSLDFTRSKMNLEIEAVKVIASQCVVHTLSLTADNWKRGQKSDVDIPLLNHYIICNETEDVLRFGQVNTDEDIQLSSGQMYPYSWRSPHNRLMHLCIDSIGDWKWTAPFDIDSDKGCTRTVKHSTHSSVVHVQLKRTGGVQKQIIFRGGIYFRNCLKNDIEFELFLHHVELIGHLHQQKITQVPKNFIVPAETTRPSMSFSSSSVTSVYLRLINDGVQGSWSSSIALPVEEDLCLPITLAVKGETFNIWYTVTRIITEQNSQLQVCACPFFVVRNHLSWPVVMTTKSRDEGQFSYLMSQGRGKETEVLDLSPKTWYNVNFQLEGTSECTDPAIPINTTFIEILKQRRKIDMQNIDFVAEWPYKDGCSIPEEQPLQIVPQRSPKHVPETPGPDLQCQLLQRWNDLPTMLIEIKPKFILNNQSNQNLFVRDAGTHLIWGFQRAAVLTSPAIQTSIQFGRVFEGSSETQWSSEIYLSELKEARQHFSQLDANSVYLYPHSSISFSIFNPVKNKCLQFAVTSKIRNDIIIISIQERFCVHNFTGLKIKCFPTLCESEEVEVEGKDFIEIADYDDPQNVNEVSLIHNLDAVDAEEPDLSKFSIRFFFYDIESSPSVLSSDHAFDLSRDHLRENTILRRSDENPVCIAMTSYMKDGVINIFIDKEAYPSFDFSNKTGIRFIVSVSLAERDAARKNGELDESWDPDIEIGPYQNFCYQCKSFRDVFPKIGNAVDCRLKLKTYGKDEILVNRLFDLNDTGKAEELPLATEKIVIAFQKAANCFFVLFTKEITEISPVQRPMNLPAIFTSISKLDVMVLDDVVSEEVFDLSIERLVVKHKVSTRKTCLGNGNDSMFCFEIGALQIDNQSTDDYDHFPVVFLPLREVSQRYRGESPQNAPFSDTHASGTNPFFKTIIRAYSSQHCSSFIDDLKVHAEPLEIYAEDSFIYRLISLTDSFAPPLHSQTVPVANPRLIVVRSVGRQILHPINAGCIEVEDLRILLSIHASLKMYLSADHMPVVLGKFNCQPTRTIQKELTRKILYHYVTQALVRAGLMLGSLEIIANPTGLIRSVGQGVADFFSLPYDGLTRGPSAFVSGISSGVGSFFRHASVGTLTSITNFASSLSRNMDRLSLDEQHMIRQEEQRCRTSSQVWPGFSNALSGFGVSLLGAIAGIVDHPITNIQNAESTRDAVKGAAKGFGKGLVGMVAKPIGGAMELISQTGQGILLGTGLTKPPMKLKAALDKQEILKLDRESYMKYLWTVIRVEFEEYANLFVITDVHISSASDQLGYSGAIILTPSAFYLYDRDSNNIRMAFACNEINLRLDEDGPYLIHLDKRDKQQGNGYCFNKIANMKDDDIRSSLESSKDSATSQSSATDFSYPISLQMHPRYTKLLLSQFFYQKDLIEEKMNNEMLEIASFE